MVTDNKDRTAVTDCLLRVPAESPQGNPAGEIPPLLSLPKENRRLGKGPDHTAWRWGLRSRSDFQVQLFDLDHYLNSITPFNSSVLKLNCQLAFPWFFFFFNLTKKKKPASWIEALGGNTGTNCDGSQSLRHRQTVTYRRLLFHFSSGWLILENTRFGSRREGC